MVDDGADDAVDDWVSEISRPCPSCAPPDRLGVLDPLCPACQGKARITRPVDAVVDDATPDDGWTFEAWRICPACQGRSVLPAQTSYPMFSSQTPRCAVCDRHDDACRRPGYEHRIFATHAEMMAFLKS